jgi:hypothetical protein
MKKRVLAIRLGVVLAIMAIVVAALGCGVGGGSLSLSPAGRSGDASVSGANKSTGVLISEDQVSSLPTWQQEMLSDPGWNSPYNEPDPGTTIQPPTDEMLEELTQRQLAEGSILTPRPQKDSDSSKGVSWNEQGNFNVGLTVRRGEYETYTGTGAPPWGCNANAGNDYTKPTKGSEDAILNYAYTNGLQRISYVLRGTAANNYFVTGSAAGNNATNAVYQLFSNDEGAKPKDPTETAQLEEISYRADLAKDSGTNQPAAPGGSCPQAQAHLVTGMFWKTFNSSFTALPNSSTTALYNVFIAPKSDESLIKTASTGTVGTYQEFYLGSQTGLFNGAWIIGIKSTVGGCSKWQDLVSKQAKTGFFHRPIYGVLLARWQDAQMPEDNGPWQSMLGWPVAGPQPLQAGVTMTSHGSYYAWGMWFEKGFIWWIDYNQTMNPTTPDEAKVYLYTGSNVYCKDGGYVAQQPTQYYGGTGPLGVTVSVDGMRYSGGDPWQIVPFNDENRRYEIPLMDDGLDTVNLAMHAQGFGGETNASGLYKFYVWAFRDGTIQAAGPAYSDSNKWVTHTYGNTNYNLEGSYVVRVQVTDGTMDNGHSAVENRAFGDSYPIVLGHSSGAVGAAVLVRNDGGAYAANYDALKADLDALVSAEVGFVYTTADYSDSIDLSTKSLVIWYRGGPAGSATPDTRKFTAGEAAKLTSTLTANVPVLLVAQNVGVSSTANWYIGYELASIVTPSLPTGYTGSSWCSALGWPYVTDYISGNHPVSGTRGTYSPTTFSLSGSTVLGERYNGAFSSGMIPTSFTITPNTGYQLTGYDRTMASGPVGAQHGAGTGPDPLTFSWGNNSTGKLNWVIAYPWSNFAVTAPATMHRWQVLQNIVAGLAPAAFSASSVPPFYEYEGQPEIIGVTPSYMDDSGALHSGDMTPTYADQLGYIGGGYPDQSSTNVYQTYDSSDPADQASRSNPNHAYVWTGHPHNDWINGNDVDFQFPWYGFVQDVDGSLVTGVVSGDEVLMGYNGLVVEDEDDVWQRNGTVNFSSREFIDIAGWDANKVRKVVGYYRTSLDLVATPALDTADKANYGTDPPCLLTWDNQYPLMAEAVVHFVDSDVMVPVLQWALFPGHSMIINGDQFPSTTNFIYDDFLTGFDVDPQTYVASRITGPFNRSIFAQMQSENQGRYVRWDFQKSSANWYGDFNLDGVINLKDKFPIRCRLLLNNTVAAPGVWPDHMFDPGSAPSNGVISADGFYVEGGCYIVDNGEKVRFLTISDNPAIPDPDVNTTYVTGTNPKQYHVNLSYMLNAVSLPTTVELDANYNGVTFGSDPTQVYTARTGITHDGTYNDLVTITQNTAGLFNFAIRASDGAQNNVYWYPTQVLLAGYTATSPWLVVDDGDATGSTALRANFAAIAPSTSYTGVTQADYLSASDPMLNFSSAACFGVFSQYDVVVWNAGGTSWTCALTDMQAQAATNAITNTDTNFFYCDQRIATNATAGSATQQQFCAAVSGMNPNYQPGTWSGQPMRVMSPITAGPGGAITAVDVTAAYTMIDSYNSDWSSATSVQWGSEGTYTGYRVISRNDPGLGYGVFFGATWSQVLAATQQKLLHNMLFQLDPAHFPPVLAPALVVPWTENFDDGDMVGWEQAGTGFNWIVGAPSIPGTYPAQSSPYVARLNTQNYPYAGGAATMILDRGGRRITAPGSYRVRMYVNGQSESGWDYLRIYYYKNGILQSTNVYTGAIGTTPVQVDYMYSNLVAGDVINLTLEFTADTSGDGYGPQVDTITITTFTPPATIWTEGFESGLGNWTTDQRGCNQSGYYWWDTARNDPANANWVNGISSDPWTYGAPASASYPAHGGTNVARLQIMNPYTYSSLYPRDVMSANQITGVTIPTTGNYYVGFYFNGAYEGYSYDYPAVQIFRNGAEVAGWKPSSGSVPAGWPAIGNSITTPTLYQQSVALTAGDVVKLRFWFCYDGSGNAYGPQFDDFFIQGPQ